MLRDDIIEQMVDLRRFIISHSIINNQYPERARVSQDMLYVKVDLLSDLIDMFPQEANAAYAHLSAYDYRTHNELVEDTLKEMR